MMTVPTYDKFMLPLLQYASDGHEHHIRDAMAAIADFLDLSEEDRNELTSGGQKTKLYDRVQWASTYLKKAGLLVSRGRGIVQITQRGMDVLSANPETITSDYLKQFPEFVEFTTPAKIHKNIDAVEVIELESEQTPNELIRTVYQRLRQEVSDDLLDYVLSSSPSFFERLVVDLLLAMGYGGSLEDAGQAIGRSGDGGIDGFIKEDKLGLDIIYLQAKRWGRDNTVGRPIVQNFVGSLMGAGATKGVLITTSRFSKDATEYADSMQGLKVILIDGQQLTQLMIEHDVGVSVEETYTVKKVDRDYFEID
jgi:restriction system protein